ncbi:aldo/keto reductase [Litorimonas cladophorae]|uniref:Aldo/keto reductase n=1 Tax=Litorimonas cladophorae TaxID=1220491 RepID=A0A918KGZ8_9PROT|nr:aldo/keto reductase [Litorimonas cladophorae]GGX63141.1 aldo/keto reductase [Litorimonas cladophorae]
MSFPTRTINGRKLNPMGLGCMSLSQGYFPLPSDDDAEKLLHRAIDIGYNHLDSARLYGLGHNEALLSRVLKTRRNEVFITSKCGIEFDEGKRWIDCRPETIRRAVEKSLTTMGVENIDLYYLHRRDFDTPIEESVGTVGDMITEGKIGAIGLSEMSAKTLKMAAAEYPIAAMQSEYSLWTRNPEIAVLEACRETNTAFVAFSPVARGALAGGVSNPAQLDPKDLRSKQPRFSDKNWERNQKLISQFNSVADREGLSPAQLSLAWVLAQGDHIHVIPGTASIPHLEENLATLDKRIEPSVFQEISELINQRTVSGHRYPDAMRKAIDTEDYE